MSEYPIAYFTHSSKQASRANDRLMTMTTTTPSSSSSCKTRIVVTADLSKKAVAKKVLPSLSDQLCAYLISHGFCEVVMVLDDNARPPTKKKRGRPPKKQPPKPAAAATTAATALQKIVVTITDKGEVTTRAVEIDEKEEAQKTKSIESAAGERKCKKQEEEGDDDDTATEIPVAVEVEDEEDESSPANSKKGRKKATPATTATKKRKRPPTRASPAASSLKKLESPGGTKKKKAPTAAASPKTKTAKAAPKKGTTKTTATAAKKDPPLADAEATSTEEDAAAVEPPKKKAKVSSQRTTKKAKEEASTETATATTKEPKDSFPAAEALEDEKGASGEDDSAQDKTATTTAASGKLKEPPAAAAAGSAETEREGAAAAAAAAEGEQQPTKKKARKKSPKQGDEGGGGETTLGKRELQWNAKFDELKEFKAQHGHCNVPNSHSKELHSWVDRQQSAKRAGKLRKDRQERMTALGIEWEDYLCGDINTTGDGNAVAGGGEAGAAAGATAAAAAATIGKRELQWNNRFEELKKFKEEHGHCNVPTTHSKDLHAWVDRQRQVKRTGKIRKDRQDKLSSLGFVWEITNHYWNKQVGPPGDSAAAAGGGDNKNGGDPSKGGEVIGRRDASWNRKFQMLKDFRKEMGHCNVPANHKELGDWIHQQRKAYKVGTLKRHRKELMDALDFEWDSKKGFQQHKFEIRFEELQQFIAENGHCKVPRSQRVLSDWVDCQRRMWRNGTLKPEREARLNTLGCFEWQTAKSFVFEDRFQQLIQYHAENGHFNVPKSYPLLGEWVHYQRQAKKQGILKEQSIARLNEIGFRW